MGLVLGLVFMVKVRVSFRVYIGFSETQVEDVEEFFNSILICRYCADRLKAKGRGRGHVTYV